MFLPVEVNQAHGTLTFYSLQTMTRSRVSRPSPAAGGSAPFRLVVAGPSVTAPLANYLDDEVGVFPQGHTYTAVVPLVADLVTRGQLTTLVTLDAGVTAGVAAHGANLEVLWGPYRRRHRMRDLMRVERAAVRRGVLHAHADLVHAHWCYEYALGALDSGVPTLISVRDWSPAILRMMSARHLPYWSGRALMYFATLVRARYLAANSPYTAARVRRYTRADLEVVPNGIPDEDFSDDRESQRPANPSGRPVIVAVNNGFSPRKNIPALLTACRALRQNGLDVEVRLLGSGYGPGEACSEWARSRRLDDGVKFVGLVGHDEVKRAMTEATVFAHPSREEAFGNTLIEAMSQRLPVVAGAHSGAVPWVLNNGRAGLLVDVNDPAELAAGLQAVIQQPDLQARLSQEGYRHAWRTFRQSRVTDLYQDAYRRILAEEAGS